MIKTSSWLKVNLWKNLACHFATDGTILRIAFACSVKFNGFPPEQHKNVLNQSASDEIFLILKNVYL
jgi:hypothetical protein